MWNSTRNTELLLFLCVCVQKEGSIVEQVWVKPQSVWLRRKSQLWRFRNRACVRHSAAARLAQASRCLMCRAGAQRKWFSRFVVWFGVHDEALWHMREVRLENRSQIWNACTWFSHILRTQLARQNPKSGSSFFFFTDLRHFQVCEMTGVDRKQPVCEPVSAPRPAGETSQPRSRFSKSETVCPRF